jgi:rhodanese-related sulfurtransferase
MKTTLREALIVCCIALLAATLSAFFHPKRPAWFQVTPEDVSRWSISEERAAELIKQGKVLWVDARPAKKFKEEHYPGAISLDLENWGDLMFEQQGTLQSAIGNPVIVYCDGTRCEKSQDVARRLRELIGLDPVFLLKGNWRKVVSMAES